MTYPETIDYLYSMLPMFQRVGSKAFKKDLGNIRRLCTALGNPHLAYRTIHVAGTNGKGSVTHLIAAALQANGLKVGVYTSPHYKDFRERIKINGTLMSEQSVIDYVAEHKDMIEEIAPSFFELTVAMAFSYFEEQKVDIAVIETGLGGIYDSTNIVEPILSVITNISYDHQNILGDTLPEIAVSKAGIIKPQVPVVIGEYQEEVIHVFIEKADEVQSSLYVASKLVRIESEGDASIQDKSWLENLEVDMDNPFLKTNLKTALQGLYLLKDELSLDSNGIVKGVNNFQTLTYYIGRMQILGTEPKIIADSAHNTAGMLLFTSYIEKQTYDRLHIIYGCVNDKDLSSVLDLCPSSATYYFCKADIPRGMDAKILQQDALKYGLHGEAYSSVAEAFHAAKKQAAKGDLIAVCGSIFVVAEIV